MHASLLPKYRGAAPIQWAIARGETSTGVTTMRINEGLDTGDMLLKWETAIGPEENAVDLSRRLAVAGAELLVRTLAELCRRSIPSRRTIRRPPMRPYLKRKMARSTGSFPLAKSSTGFGVSSRGLAATASARTAVADLERGRLAI